MSGCRRGTLAGKDPRTNDGQSMDHEAAAIVFWVLLAAAVVAYAFTWCWRSPYGLWQATVYFVTLLLTRVLWRTQVPPFPLPLGQGAVIVCNHRTSVDPFFIQIVVNRYVRWMVAREYCEHPAFGWFLRATHAIPTNRRGNDTAATKLAIRSASQGDLIGMFPEGHINHTDEFMLPGRPGAILVALKARVPILPCYIEGAPYAGSVISPLPDDGAGPSAVRGTPRPIGLLRPRTRVRQSWGTCAWKRCRRSPSWRGGTISSPVWPAENGAG